MSVCLSFSLSFITTLCSDFPCIASSPLADEQTEGVLQEDCGTVVKAELALEQVSEDPSKYDPAVDEKRKVVVVVWL